MREEYTTGSCRRCAVCSWDARGQGVHHVVRLVWEVVCRYAADDGHWVGYASID